MTVFKTYTQTAIDSGEVGGFTVRSCFGLPGSEGLPASYMHVRTTLEIFLSAERDVYARFVSGVIEQTNIYGTEWNCFFSWRAYPYTISGNDRTNEFFSFSYSRDTSPGTFSYSFPSASPVPLETDVTPGDYGLARLCSLSEVPTDGQRGWLYIAGTADDVVEDPIYPEGFKVFITDFVEKLLDYFPCAVRVGGVWKRCNRSGGNVQIKAAGKWEDAKNTHTGDGSRVFIKRGGEWEKQVETGEV